MFRNIALDDVLSDPSQRLRDNSADKERVSADPSILWVGKVSQHCPYRKPRKIAPPNPPLWDS